MDEDEDEVDDYFEAKLGALTFGKLAERRNPMVRVYFNEAEYHGDDVILGRYLETLQHPDGLTDQHFIITGADLT